MSDFVMVGVSISRWNLVKNVEEQQVLNLPRSLKANLSILMLLILLEFFLPKDFQKRHLEDCIWLARV